MRRVASRQRLFSWDAFDANAEVITSSDDESNYATCYSSSNRNASFQSFRPYFDEESDCVDYARLDTSPSADSAKIENYHIPRVVSPLPFVPSPQTFETKEQLPTQKRDSICSGVKKSVSFSNINFCHERISHTKNEEATNDQIISFLRLNQDMQVEVLSFLPFEALHCVGMTCRYFHNFLVVNTSLPEEQTNSLSRNTIWWSLITQKWSHLRLLASAHSCHNNLDETVTSSLPKTAMTPKNTIFFDNRNPSPSFDFGESKKEVHGSSSISSPSKNKIYIGAYLKHTPTEAPPTQIDPRFYITSSVKTTDYQKIPEFIAAERFRVNPSTILTLQRMAELKKKAFTCYDMKIPSSLSNRSSDNDIVKIIQFTGIVGAGDRSITSNKPFPLPLESLPVFKKSRSPDTNVVEDENHDKINTVGRMINRRRKRKDRRSSSSRTATTVPSPRHVFHKMLERGINCQKRCLGVAAAAVKNSSMRKALIHQSEAERGSIPFVSPFVVKISDNGSSDAPTTSNENFRRYYEIDLTPRLMAYFEVSILKRDLAQEPKLQLDTDLLSHRDTNRRRRQVSTECVAVGLSVRSSPMSTIPMTESRMPGWDSNSYGYHGDDGGIFHSHGNMLRVYGPKYGEGDTVGCGVNYESGGIFFTLNGNFLGYAWEEIQVVQDGKKDLFPTVGVDSNSPLVCNFGDVRPFVFDFAKFVANKGSVNFRSV